LSSGQAIRQSQFVLTYGVGSILEAPNGPRIILSFENWGRIFGTPQTSVLLSRYEIGDANVSALLRGGRIFRLPTNADMQIPDEQVLFRTGRFPRWALCQDHRVLYELSAQGTTRCPYCDLRKTAQHEAIRFVRACPKGHLDDVDWKRIVHRNNPACDGKLFDWIERGSTLRDIMIRCRSCGSQATLQDIYNGTWTCSGRFPESGYQEMCDEQAYVILRNASNLRIPEIVSALTIPPRTTPLHRVLENPRIFVILASESSWTKEKLLLKLKTAAQRIPEINPITIGIIERASENEILSAIDDVLEPPRQDLTVVDIKNKELQALQNAALNGAPPRPYAEPQDFEVDKNAVTQTALSANLNLRVTPVKRLRVIIAQKGYRRPVRGPTSTVVETFYRDGQDRWYVGAELHGEGVFIDLVPSEILELADTEVTEMWWTEFGKTKNYAFHPVFVWWHTLSHRLIKALSIDSGYSSASIRERVYITTDEESDNTYGGVLFYTSQHGGDGSLGGLIALVPRFDVVISAALRNLHSCSNDPLCSEQRLRGGRLNGAACYACLLVSETSCEFGNSYLDRNLLRETIS